MSVLEEALDVPKKADSRLGEAFLLCVRRLEPDLVRIARSFSPHDHDWAQDLVQEAVVKGYGYYREGRLELAGGIKSWFATAIRHEHLMRLRKDKRIVRGVEITDEPTQASHVIPVATNGVESVGQDLSPRLEAEIMSLPDVQRQVVVLVDLEELSYEEAAQSLGIPVGTVRSRLFRARGRLAVALGGAFAEGEL